MVMIVSETLLSTIDAAVVVTATYTTNRIESVDRVHDKLPLQVPLGSIKWHHLQ